MKVTIKTRIKTSIPGQAFIGDVEVDIVPGDRVRLQWYGDRNIPKTLNFTGAEVLQVNEQYKSFKVKASMDAYGTRTIGARHIRNHYPKGADSLNL